MNPAATGIPYQYDRLGRIIHDWLKNTDSVNFMRFLFKIAVCVILAGLVTGCGFRAHPAPPDRPAVMQTEPPAESSSPIVVDASPSQPIPASIPNPSPAQPDTAVPAQPSAESPVSVPQPLDTAQSTPAPASVPSQTDLQQPAKPAETPKPAEPTKPVEPTKPKDSTATPETPKIPPAEKPVETPKPAPSAQPLKNSDKPAKTAPPPPVPAPENPEEAARKAEQEALAKLPPFYALYAELLKAYVDEKGNVDYGTLRRKRGDLLDATRLLEDLDPQQVIFWTQEEKIALWINAHNLFTIKLIVDNYPIKASVWGMWYPPNSIMQISGARDKTYFKMMGLEYTLREIERDILIKRFEDPRICFTLSYASMGGAFLRNEPYYPHRLDRQLDEQVQRFVRSPRGVLIEQNPATLQLSDIFVWYKDLMIAKYGSIKKFRDRPDDIRSYLNCILPYLKPEDVQFIETTNPAVKLMKYDWQLNEK